MQGGNLQPHNKLITPMKAELLPPLNPLANIFLAHPKPQPAPPTQTTLSKLPPGAKTIGNYLLGKNIGQGSFGKVHLAMHLPTGEKVAVKIIDKMKMRPKDVERVSKQINILTRVRHRHVVTLYQIIETEKNLLLVTEFLPNGELFRLILKEKRLSEDQACAYFQQIVEAVEYLHRNNIAHRDLKPQNILIDYDGKLKLIDFGLSACYEGRERLSTFCGSPCYASPQMVEGKNSYNPLQTDLWSCGIILFTMLCGHLPFCDPDTHTLFKKIMACNYKISSYLSPEAQDLIQRLLVLAPDQRISLEEIREHRWFNRVAPASAYGLDLGEQLPVDKNIVEKMKAMGVTGKRLREEVMSNLKGKDTATYFILMKKLVKAGEIVPTCLSSDHFDPKLIIRNEEKLPHQSDTESYNEPYSSENLIKAPDAPQVPQDVIGGPSAGSALMDNIYYSDQEVKQIDEGELMLLAGGILDLFLPKAPTKPDIGQIKEVLTPVSHPFSELALQKRSSQFYANNKALAKKLVSLAALHTFKIRSKTLRPPPKIDTRNQQHSSFAERRKMLSESKQSNHREKTEPSRSISKPITQSDHPKRTPLSRNGAGLLELLNLGKKSDIVLPSLPQRVQQLRTEVKSRYLDKKSKVFKNIIH